MSAESLKKSLKRSHDGAIELTQGTPDLDDVYDAGDFVLISTDGIAFKTQPFYFQAASSVFRDAMGGGSGPYSLQLYESFERARIVRFIFNIVTGKSIPTVKKSGDIARLGDVMRFCRKYDCETIFIFTAKLLEIECLNDQNYQIWVFRQAAQFGLDDLCVLAIRQMPPHIWVSAAEDPPMDTYLLAPCLDLSNASFQFCRDIPVEYAWSLQHAYKKKTTNEDIATEFLALLKQAKAYEPEEWDSD